MPQIGRTQSNAYFCTSKASTFVPVKPVRLSQSAIACSKSFCRSKASTFVLVSIFFFLACCGEKGLRTRVQCRLTGERPRSSPPAAPPAAYVSIRQHTSAYVSIRQHTSAYVFTIQSAHNMLPRLGKPLVRSYSNTHTHLYNKLNIYIGLYIYVYMYICIYI